MTYPPRPNYNFAHNTYTSSGPSVVPVARHSACESLGAVMGLASVAVCGVVPAADIVPVLLASAHRHSTLYTTHYTLNVRKGATITAKAVI